MAKKNSLAYISSVQFIHTYSSQICAQTTPITPCYFNTLVVVQPGDRFGTKLSDVLDTLDL